MTARRCHSRYGCGLQNARSDGWAPLPGAAPSDGLRFEGAGSFFLSAGRFRAAVAAAAALPSDEKATGGRVTRPVLAAASGGCSGAAAAANSASASAASPAGRVLKKLPILFCCAWGCALRVLLAAPASSRGVSAPGKSRKTCDTAMWSLNWGCAPIKKHQPTGMSPPQIKKPHPTPRTGV